MSSLDEIRAVASCFGREELKTARSFMYAIDGRGEKGPTVTIKLFEIFLDEIKTGKTQSREYLWKEVYGGGSKKTFNKLLERMRNKLFESLILDINIGRDDVYSERTKTMFLARKKVTVAQILIARGQLNIASNLLEETLRETEKYELYEECLLAMNCMFQIYLFEKRQGELQKLIEKHSQILTALRVSIKAQNAFHQLGYTLEHSTILPENELLWNQITDLRNDLLAGGSATVSFYLNFIEAQYWQQNKKYKTADEVLRRQVDLVHHPAVRSAERLGLAILNVAANCVYLRQFDEAIDNCKKALNSLGMANFNSFQCQELYFHALFYIGDYQRSLAKIDELIKRDTVTDSDFRTGRRIYLKACCLFMLQDFQQVQNLLNILNPIEEDKRGWNIVFRILFIMNDVERGNYENADKRLNTLQRHIMKVNYDITPRQRLIYEVLRILSNQKYDFSNASKKTVEQIEKLQSFEDDFSWQILSSEMIIFDQWFLSKVFKENLLLKIPPHYEPLTIE